MTFVRLMRISVALAALLLLAPGTGLAQSDKKKDEKKDDKKKPAEPFTVQKLTQGMGLYALGAISPDRKFMLLLAQKPEQAPNLYVMNLTDHSIRPALTNFRWGASDPRWSPDGQSVALAGFSDTASFSELYIMDVKTGRLRQMTKNNFNDKEPVFTPDGKRVLYTTDESPLPDAAFGILHIAVVAVGGGKAEAFTEDEGSSIHPGVSADGKSVLLVKVDESSGRHSLWQYGFDGKPLKDLTGRKFARIHQYLENPTSGTILLWAQEEVEQQDDLYVLDLKSGNVTELPDPDQRKRNPTVSPNGSLIAFIGPAAIGTQLFVYDSTTGQIKQLTTKPANTHSPVFISDHEIMFGSDRDRESEVYVIDLNPPASTEKKK
jgi:Tol biopolymer transport system component